MKAPSATEYPKTWASSAEAKQIPTLATSVVSARSSRTAASIRRGTISIPQTRRLARNARSRPPAHASSRAETELPTETVERIASRRMTIRSSTIRMPKTVSVNFPLMLCSENALMMIVVLEMARIAPA